MWILDNSDLPLAEITVNRRTAIAFRLWYDESKQMAPLAKVDALEGYEKGQVFYLGNPFNTSYYYQIQLPTTLSYGVVEGTAWADNDVIHLYGPSRLLNTSYELTLRWVAAVGADGIEVIDVGPNFTATAVKVNGLTFSPGTALGQFQQAGEILSIKGGGYPFTFNPGDFLEVSGIFTASDISPSASIAQFSVPELDIIPSRLDWLAQSFNYAIDTLHPQVGQFSWDFESTVLTLYLPPGTRLPETSKLSGRLLLLKNSSVTYTAIGQA